MNFPERGVDSGDRMSFSARLLLQLGLALLAPGLLAWIAATSFFPLAEEQRSVLLAAIPLAALALDGLGTAAAFWLCRPIGRALRAPADRATASRGALAAHRLPARLSATLVALWAAAVAAAAWTASERGTPGDLVAAGVAVGVAAAVLAAMLAYAVSAVEGARALAELPAAPFLGKGTVRGKILLVGYGILTAALLLFAAAGYVGFRRDGDTEYLEHAQRVQESALALSRGAPGAQAAELVWRALGAPTAVVGAEGRVLARAGPEMAQLSEPGAQAGARRAGAGWLVRRDAAGGAALVSFLPDEPLLARRAAFWRTALGLGLLVYAAAALLVWLAARTLTVPLEALGRAAARMAAGDLAASAPSLSRDEVGRVASEFRRMTRGLTGLLGEVGEAARDVAQAARELGQIGERVRRGALEQHDGVLAVDAAAQAMQGSIDLVKKGMDGLGEYVAATSAAVSEMAAAMEEVRRQGGELERSLAQALEEAGALGDAGRKAREALETLEAVADRTRATQGAVSTSLSGLELASVASQLNAAQAAELAEHAERVVGEAVSGIESVRAAVADAQRRVTVLGRRAGDIDQIVDFISGVAGRTNLLSLNASIIAAQAGEHGRPFGVVAEQIRELAAQIASSTKSIADIIRAVRDDVEGTAALISRGDALAAAGVRLAQASVQALAQIRSATTQGHENAAAIQSALATHVRSSREVSELVGSVGAGTRAVSQAVERVGGSLSALAAVQRGVRAVADRITRALAEQTGLGRQQLHGLERIDATAAEASRAAADHGAATRQVHDSLLDLARAARHHEAAVAELAALGERLGGRAKALSERVERFRTD